MRQTHERGGWGGELMPRSLVCGTRLLISYMVAFSRCDWYSRNGPHDLGKASKCWEVCCTMLENDMVLGPWLGGDFIFGRWSVEML
jgi:hypothetical protein